jgi:C2 domain
VSVEVHRITSHLPKNGTSSYDECIIRVLAPKKRPKKGEEVDDDDGSVETNTAEFLDPHKDASGSEAEDTMYPGWRAKYRFPIRCVHLKGTRRNSVHMDIQFGKRKESREIIFAIKEDAARFHALLQSEMALDADRTDRKMQVALGAMANQILAQPATTFLVEIVSAWDLPAADLFSSDPFVSCILDSVEVHRTEFISKTLDPIWTIATGSLFLLSDVQLPQLFRGEGLLCIVYDFDKFGANDPLGAVTIPPKTIYDAQGERMELELGPPPGKLKQEDGSYGTLAVRIRRATQYDIEFMENVKKRDKGTIQVPGMKQALELDDHSTFHGGKGNIHSMLSRRYRTCKSGPNMGKREVRRENATISHRSTTTSQRAALISSAFASCRCPVQNTSRARSETRR